MSKKDYILIAQALKKAQPTAKEIEVETMMGGWINCIREISIAFGQDNNRFDSDIFLEACGLEE